MVGESWRRRLVSRGAGALLALGLLLPLAAPGAALAHERRAVGPYTFVVGFANEPAIQNQMNGASVRISKTDGGTPVEGAAQTLKVQVASGGNTPKELALRAVSGQPGLYQADLMPTSTGSYVFTFTGTLEGTPVNEKFESGPGRFDDVRPLADYQIPAAAAAPSTQPAPQAAASTTDDRVADAEAAAAQARMFGIGGLVVGLIGLATGAVALLSARRSSGAAGVASPAAA